MPVVVDDELVAHPFGANDEAGRAIRPQADELAHDQPWIDSRSSESTC
jgi:hypothetical protein